MKPARSVSSRSECAALALLTLAVLLPFLAAAVSIDAPVFLAVAKQILAHPADPYGFEMIWDPTSPHVAVFNRNPPLLSYYLALWIGLFGEREVLLHAALLPFPLIAVLAFYGIARRLAALDPAIPGLPAPGFVAAALFLATPAFMLLATTLMLDVPMLAAWLCAVYAMLRARDEPGVGWPIAAGVAVAVAGFTKYVGIAAAPLLAAGLVALPPRLAGDSHGRRGRSMAALWMIGVPVTLWVAWAIYTQRLYGFPHVAGGFALASGRSFAPDAFWNHALSLPIYYGAGLLFPLFIWLRGFRHANDGVAIAVCALIVGTFAAYWVLPHGEPARRSPLGTGAALLAVFCFASAVTVWGRALRGLRPRSDPEDAFLGLWAFGVLVFSLLVNWHVNAADALLAAPPLILLVLRNRALCPGKRSLVATVMAMLLFTLLLTTSDVAQRAVYRDVAERIRVEIGDQPGRRWFVGHWGFQYYLAREGFEPIVPPQYARLHGRSELEAGDWIVSARNVSQLDVSQTLSHVQVRGVWHWSVPGWLPLRATHADSGGGFYSHHVGYSAFSWHDGPLDEIGLGRVIAVDAAPLD